MRGRARLASVGLRFQAISAIHQPVGTGRPDNVAVVQLSAMYVRNFARVYCLCFVLTTFPFHQRILVLQYNIKGF